MLKLCRSGNPLLRSLLVMSVVSAFGQVCLAEPGNPEWFREDAQLARAADPGRPIDAAPIAAPLAAERARDPRDPRDLARVPEPIFGRPNHGGMGYGGYGGASGYGFAGYPAAEVQNWVIANARAATARALFRRADSELGQAYRAAQRSFERSLEYNEAVAAERSAYEALTAARRRAISSIANDPRYQRLVALKLDVAEQLETRRANKDISPSEILAMAALKMTYATDLRAMEAEAMANEASVKDTQEKLVAAHHKVVALRQRYEDSLRVSPEIMLARRNLEDARIAKITAESYLRGAYLAGESALDYAYWINYRYTRGPVYTGYGYNPGYWAGY